MSGSIRLTVVIPCFNHGAYLEEALASVPEGPTTEVLVIDDGSTDEATIKVIRKVEDAGYKVIRQANKGVASARNAAIAQARGTYILPLDADNRLVPSAIVSACAWLDKNPEIDVVYGDKRIFGEASGYSVNRDFDPAFLLYHHHIDTCALFRKSAWEKSGGYPENMPFPTLEDWGFWIRCLQNGIHFQYQEGCFFEYRHLKSSKLRQYQGQDKVRLAQTLWFLPEKQKALDLLRLQCALDEMQARKLQISWELGRIHHAWAASDWPETKRGIISLLKGFSWLRVITTGFRLWREKQHLLQRNPYQYAGKYRNVVYPDNLTEKEFVLLNFERQRCRHYLEFGAGESTRKACADVQLKATRVVESDARFFHQGPGADVVVQKSISEGHCRVFLPDLGPVRDWGIPTDKSYRSRWPTYSREVFKEQIPFDLVFVDGRFRVACALAALLELKNPFRVLIHDFPNRPQYHILLPFFEVENQVGRLVVLLPKPGFNRSEAEKLYQKYAVLPEDKTIAFRLRYGLLKKLQRIWARF
jgi:glycosyltransferase involved in cell wall biosynthesis